MKYKQELSRQFALDYCCNVEDILDNKNHFNVYEQRDGRRRFEEQDDCVLKVIVVNEKLIFTGKKEIVNICKEKYETCSGVWFMDVARFRELDTILKSYGYQLKTAHPFFYRRNLKIDDRMGRKALVRMLCQEKKTVHLR